MIVNMGNVLAVEIFKNGLEYLMKEYSFIKDWLLYTSLKWIITNNT